MSWRCSRRSAEEEKEEVEKEQTIHPQALAARACSGYFCITTEAGRRVMNFCGIFWRTGRARSKVCDGGV